jgi:hypothetical protein
MYSTRPNLVIGFHGCETEDQQRLLSDIAYFKKSQKSYDWLGHGMYFWENNPLRAKLWADQKKKSGTLKEPAVIGAVLDLGHCFDLLDSNNIYLLKESYELFKSDSQKIDRQIPTNKNHPKDIGDDKVLRYLDCAVIEYTHSFLENEKERPFDSVRAAFIEGNQIYPMAGFREKTHIQICITNSNCIKGFFLQRNISTNFPTV